MSKEKKEPVFNETNFRKLIRVIDVSGRSWLDCDSDMLNDEWNTALTHRNPDILRGFGFQCVDRADLIEAVKIVDDFQEEQKKTRNGTVNYLKSINTEEEIKIDGK
jgi:hypothetical protein|tara:strand:- start:74 stop:391 length:318 start_codon:yes stop_codon:yes gene_type:complete